MPRPQITTLEALRQRIADLERLRLPRATEPISCGCRALDALLPHGGFRPGTLVEWIAVAANEIGGTSESDGAGAGIVALALKTAVEALRRGGMLIVLDPRREFYPPAAAALGVEVERMILVETHNAADYQWALDQSLRCPAVAAALAWLERTEGHAFRRLQLAAEEGGGLGLLLRPAAARNEPSWADVRLAVTPRPLGERSLRPPRAIASHPVREGAPRAPGGIAPQAARGAGPLSAHELSRRRWQVEILRCRGGAEGSVLEWELNDDAHLVPVVASLADPTAPRRASR